MDVGRVQGVRHELPQHLQLLVELNSQHLMSDLLLLVHGPVAELWADRHSWSVTNTTPQYRLD